MIRNIIILSLFLTFFLAAQSGQDFVPEAIVTLTDGTTLELGEFAFYESQQDESFGKIVVGITKKYSAMDDIFISQGCFWNIVPLSDIQKLEFIFDSLKDDSFRRKAIITLTSGNMITGIIALRPDLTWKIGDSFVLKGKTHLLGESGIFRINMKNIRSIVNSEEKTNSYVITNMKRKTVTVSNLELLRIWDRFHSQQRYTYDDNDEIKFSNENITLDLKIKNIESINYEEDFGFIYNKKVEIKMKNGEKAEGTHLSGYYIFGKTDSGQIFFENIPKISSVKFK